LSLVDLDLDGFFFLPFFFVETGLIAIPFLVFIAFATTFSS